MKSQNSTQKRSFSAKKLFLKLHNFFGLTAGLYYVLLGLSGSYIVYLGTFQSWIAPSLRASSAPTDQVALAPLVASAQQGLSTEATPIRVAFPKGEARSAEVTFNLPTAEERRRFVTAFVDPVTLNFLGSESFKDTASGKIFTFHHDLFLGQTGRTIMGVCGLLMLLILATGVYLILPKRKAWIMMFKARPMRSLMMFSHETHRLLGLYSLVLMVLVTFSGVYISKPAWFQGEGGGRPQGGRPEGGPPPTMDFATVADEFKTLKRPIELRIDARKQTIQVEGQIEESKEPKTFAQNQRAIHGGHFWGTLGKILVFLSGLLPLYFYATGLIIWRKKHAHS